MPRLSTSDATQRYSTKRAHASRSLGRDRHPTRSQEPCSILRVSGVVSIRGNTFGTFMGGVSYAHLPFIRCFLPTVVLHLYLAIVEGSLRSGSLPQRTTSCAYTKAKSRSKIKRKCRVRVAFLLEITVEDATRTDRTVWSYVAVVLVMCCSVVH